MMVPRMSALLATLALCAPLAAQEKAVDAPGWEKDLAKAKSLARKTKRPIFLVFR